MYRSVALNRFAVPAGKLATSLGTRRTNCRTSYPRASSMSYAHQELPSHEAIMKQFENWIPDLSGANYKGQHGRICVVGGCVEYTGAPYFAAMSSMKTGADLTYVISMPEAAPIIKSFSPDMMVLPMLPNTHDTEAASFAAHEERVKAMVARLSTLVVGPGLGDDPGTTKAAASIISMAREANVPILVDGSGLNIIAQRPDLVKGYSSCLLTPNVAELGRLAKAVGVELQGPISAQWQSAAADIAAAFQGPVLVSKGPVDVVTDGAATLTSSLPGSLKRSGGQGDVLAGVTATFASWIKRGLPFPLPSLDSSPSMDQELAKSLGVRDVSRWPFLVAAYAGCSLMRSAARKAFEQHRRATLAPHIIEAVPETFEQLFPTK